MERKKYEDYSLRDSQEIFTGYVKNYSVADDILVRLAKDIGMSMELYETLSKINKSAADDLVISMSISSKHEKIYLLIDEGNAEILGYSLDSERTPLLNSDFVKRVTSLVETSDAITISEQYVASDDTKSSVIIRKLDPIVIDTGRNTYSYDIGVLLVNDELENTYCRMVVYTPENQPVYLPGSYYNLSTSRYKRSTQSTAEALECLVLRVIEDLRDESIMYKVSDYDMRYRINKDVVTSYEEYNTLLRSMMRIPSIIDDNSFLASLSEKYGDFERKYSHLDEQKSSYIWRCTATTNMTIGAIVSITCKILDELRAPAMEYYRVRELLGEYLSTNRIVEEIAKEND